MTFLWCVIVSVLCGLCHGPLPSVRGPIRFGLDSSAVQLCIVVLRSVLTTHATTSPNDPSCDSTVSPVGGASLPALQEGCGSLGLYKLYPKAKIQILHVTEMPKTFFPFFPRFTCLFACVCVCVCWETKPDPRWFSSNLGIPKFRCIFWYFFWDT